MSGRGDPGRGRGDRGRGRGVPRGRGSAEGSSRGSSPARGGPNPRGAAAAPRGGPPQRGGGGGGYQGSYPPRGGRGGPPAAPAPTVQAPPEGPATLDTRISSIQAGVDKFKAISLARKDPKNPLRPGFGTLGTAIVVRANFFALKFPKGLIIHDYRAEITPTTDIGRLKGRILELLLDAPQFAPFKSIVAHDRSERIISAKALPEPLSVDILFIEEGETQPSAKAKKYSVKITKTGELDTDALNKYV